MATSLPLEAYALLDSIAGPESKGSYSVIYGGNHLLDYTDHPRTYVPIKSGPNAGKKSSAAGRYQFLADTWDEAKETLGLPDFSPQSQDAAAWWLAQRDYAASTGRDLLSDLQSGDANTIKSIGSALSGTWTSLPGGIEQGVGANKFVNSYANALMGTDMASTQFVNPAFGGAQMPGVPAWNGSGYALPGSEAAPGMGAPAAPQLPMAPPPFSAAAPGGDVSDDDLLKMFLDPGAAGGALPAAAVPASPVAAPADGMSDDDLLKQFLPQETAKSATVEPAAPAGMEQFSDLPYPGNPNFNPIENAPNQPGVYGESLPAQVMSGFNEGMANMAGLPVDVATGAINLGLTGANALMPAAPGATQPRFPLIENPVGGSQQINQLLSGAGAIYPETDDPYARFGRRMAEDIGATTIPLLGTVGRAAQPLRMVATELGLGAGSGAGAAIAQEKAPDQPLMEIGGQILGMLSVGGLAKGAKKLITPFDIPASRQAAIDVMEREGVSLTPGQKTGSKSLQYLESELGGAKIADMTDAQADQFTKAALSRAGISGERATPEVMADGLRRIGDEFDGLAARNTMVADQALANDLTGVWSDYTNVVNPSARVPAVENTIRDVANALTANGGTISGEAYQTLASRIEKIARGTGDNELASALRGIKASLDGAMERTLQAQNSPDLGAWRQARSDYRNFLVLEKAAQGAGENAAMGAITPAKLRAAAQSVYGKRSFVTGRDPFAELAQAGQATMTPLPQSGTAPRIAARNMLMNAPAVAGGFLGHELGQLPGAALGWAAGKAVPNMATAAILSRPGQAYLTNQLLRFQAARDAAGTAAVPAALGPYLQSQQQRRPIDITVRGGNPLLAQ